MKFVIDNFHRFFESCRQRFDQMERLEDLSDAGGPQMELTEEAGQVESVIRWPNLLQEPDMG